MALKLLNQIPQVSANDIYVKLLTKLNEEDMPMIN